MTDQMSFDDLNGAETDDSDESEYPETHGLDEYLDDGESVVGVLQEHKTDVGKYDSSVYVLKLDEDTTVGFWGNGSVDAQFDELGVQVGDVMGIARDGTYENKYGEFTNYEVRFKSFDP